MTTPMAIAAGVGVLGAVVVALWWLVGEDSPDYVSEGTRRRILADNPGGCAYLGQPWKVRR